MVEINYTRCGDYLIPNLTINEPPTSEDRR